MQSFLFELSSQQSQEFTDDTQRSSSASRYPPISDLFPSCSNTESTVPNELEQMKTKLFWGSKYDITNQDYMLELGSLKLGVNKCKRLFFYFVKNRYETELHQVMFILKNK